MRNFNRTKPLLFFVFALLLLKVSFAFAADIQLRVDRSLVEVNETFTLIFETSDSVDDDPDFTPLEKDFQLLGQSSSSNYSIINGNYTKSQRWSVSVMALKEGTITIPSIHFGKDISPEYQITIKPVQTSNGKQGDEFISELEINTDTAYPQSQVIVTQRLLSSRNINGYEFSQLKFSGVDVATETLGEIKQYQTKRGDMPYLVLEQNYAVYPQTAGTLVIDPSVATARVSLSNRSPYDAFRGNTKTLRRASEARSITVNSVPDAFKGQHWLPAREVQLVEEFPQNSNYKVGEPVTRTLSLLADGQSASQLPELSIPEIRGLKQYPDKPVLNNNVRDDGITGIQQIKVAIIPTQAGDYTLPAISIPWWNTKTKSMQIAKIEARHFTVTDAAITSTTPTLAPQKPAELSTPVKAPEVFSQTEQNLEPELTPVDNPLWKILSVLFALAWIITLIVFYQSKKQKKSSNPEKTVLRPSFKQARRQLESACETASSQACKDALINWGNALFINQPVFALGELAIRVNQPLSDKINNLNALLYKNDSSAWQCENLLELCDEFAEAYIQQQSAELNENHLEDMYR